MRRRQEHDIGLKAHQAVGIASRPGQVDDRLICRLGRIQRNDCRTDAMLIAAHVRLDR